MYSCQLKHITYTYPERKLPALWDVSLSIKEGTFTLISGVSGSGKSTLGKVIKGIIPTLYGGALKGQVEVDTFGYVLQDPEKQMLMSTVERELAFGMENLQLSYNIMHKRVAEILDYIGLSQERKEETRKLSGGQQQKLAIGCAIAMGCKGLILDEPTGQLDPVSSSEVLTLVRRLNEELGMTILLIEQKLDKVFEMTDRVLYLKEGQLVFDGCPKRFVLEKDHQIEDVLSGFTLAFKSGVEDNLFSSCPLSVKEGRKILEPYWPQLKKLAIKMPKKSGKPVQPVQEDSVLSLENIVFSYNRQVNHLYVERLQLKKGHILGVIGENGSGKSTLLKIMSGVIRPQKGQIEKPEVIGFLSQNPNDYFFELSLKKEIQQVLTLHQLEWTQALEEQLSLLGLTELLNYNPRDLSGGQRQRAALAIVLASNPKVLLLDEPTRGLNKGLKRLLIQLLKQLKEEGLAIGVISHDMNFIADLTDTVAIISSGRLEVVDTTQNLLSDGLFYVSDFGKLFSPFGLSVTSSQEGHAQLMALKEGK